MSVNSFMETDLFRYTIIKHHENNPADAWANTYEAQANDAGGPVELLVLGDKLVEFERVLHHNTTVFDRMIISTWEPDTSPYNPINFMTKSLGLLGNLTPLGSAVGLTQCFHVTRDAGYGRAGHLFLRNCLEENQVSAPSGITVFTSHAAMVTLLQSAVDDSGLDDHYGTIVVGALRLVLISASGDLARPVQTLSAAGVSQVKTDHKWYNRTGSP